MCKAIDDMIEEGRKEGREEGLKEGRNEGRKEGRTEIIDEIKKLSADGLSLDQIVKKIEQKNNRKPRTRKKNG